VLRYGSGQNLRDYLIATAARLIDQRGSAGLAVRDIAREAKVADGVLYNYFEDKEDLLAHALLVHVGNVMAGSPQLLPPPGEGTIAANLRQFIDGGLARLVRVVPAFAGLLAQPKVLIRFHAMVGGDAAFDSASADDGHGDDDARSADGTPDAGEAPGAGEARGRAPSDRSAGSDDDANSDDGPPDGGDAHSPAGGQGLPEVLTNYLRAEQELGRIDPAADVAAVSSLVVGAIHGQILPRVLFSPPGSPIVTPPGLAARLAETLINGIAPKPPDRELGTAAGHPG
jgi:AcrR family transcriptional regulator